jgi:hypothetical protein
MRRLSGVRDAKTLGTLLLAVVVVVLAAILLLGQVAEAQRGGGGRGGGGGGGGKPSYSSSSKPSNSADSASVSKDLPPGVANPNSSYYNSPRYGVRYGSLSNFFLWSWLFHHHDDEEYEEEYIQANADSSGWFVTALGLVALVGFPIWILRRRSKG